MKRLLWMATTAGLFLGCATVVSPGPGATGEDARKRLVQQELDAQGAALERSLRAAEASPDDLRAQRKAVKLAERALREGREEKDRAIYEAVLPVVRRLETHPESCTLRIEAGRVHALAQQNERAAENFIASVETCRSVEALRAASYPLKELKRCGELVKLAEQVWPGAEQSQWVPIMDTVKTCSDSVSLRRNLAFVPSDVVEEYVALLNARERERRRNTCASHCYQSRQSCESGCWSSSACYSSCASLESACLASCS